MRKLNIDPEKRDKAIDGTIKVLKTFGRDDILFGSFLLAEGLALIFAQSLFPVFIVLSILIAYAFAIEWFVNVLRGEKTILNILQRILAAVLIIALLVFCGFMIFSPGFQSRMDLILVSATTILDGLKNTVHTLKIEKFIPARNVLLAWSGLCIIYGIAYALAHETASDFFFTTLHGIIIIFCGLTNIWLAVRSRRAAFVED